MNKPSAHGEAIRFFLQDEFLKRKQKNSHLSLRAFARLLKIAPGRLSEYLSGRRQPSVNSAIKLMTRLGANSRKCLELIELSSTTKPVSQKEYLELREDQFKALASWEHFALLSLMETDDFDPRPQVIARRLGISTVEARDAFDRLERLGLINQKTQNRWQPSQSGLKTSEDISSAALRESHRQSLLQAIDCLESVPTELRDVSSITMAINTQKISEAKKLIRQFRRDLAGLLEEGPRYEVFNLNIQLVPVTKIQNRRTRT